MSAPSDVTNASPRRPRRRSAKCLFGPPDRDETQRLVSEHYAWDRKRYIRRFNFDIETESAYVEEPESTPPSIRSATEALAALSGPELVLPTTPTRRRAPRTPSKLSPRSPRMPSSLCIQRSPRTPTSRRHLHMTDYWTIRKPAKANGDMEND